jgi:hypothetical protein
MTRTLALFAVGAAVLFFFETTVTLAAGIIILVASIVSGVFATATPAFLAGDEGENG